jgi:cytoskeletal protein RodZ
MALKSSVTKGGLGWGILLFALAIPGFLFFNWWSNLKAERDRGLSSKSRSRQANPRVFQPAPDRRLVNPISTDSAKMPQSAAAIAIDSKLIPAVSTDSAIPTPEEARIKIETPISTPSVINKQVETSVSTSSYVLSRDPMMSPMDVVRIREREIENIRHAEELRLALERQSKMRTRKKKVIERPIENFIELQGIVTTPGGDTLLIVNGVTLTSGGTFPVSGHSGKVSVISISPSDVIFEYKGKRFKKRVNVE